MVARVNELVRLLREGVPEGANPNRRDYPISGSIPLPGDYVDTIVEIGSGFYIDEKFSVLHPRVVSQDFRQHQDDLVRIHEAEGIYFRDGKLLFPGQFSPDDDYVRFSKLICWGLENSGKKVFWDSSGSSDYWHVIATDCSDSWVRHKIKFSDYLYGILSRELICPVLTGPAWPRGIVSELDLHEIDI
ncbi:hypothetical protein [Nocardiopsis sp. CA-288880]|uniref:hypothetical protein n=1 Tax=Nocardiopsis sp. CA-288880 TaxID=3239995 RepID=UPI003D95AD26